MRLARFDLSSFLLAPASAASAAAQTPPPAVSNSAPAPAASFSQTLRPFLEQHCQPCHNGKLRSGDVNFEVLKFANSPAAQPTTWETTAYVMKTGRMPPAGRPKPPQDQVQSAISVIELELAKAGEAIPAKSEPLTREWLTWQGNPERTGWARAETTLSKENVSRLGLLWKTQLDAAPGRLNFYATLTDPLVVEDVVTRQGPKKLVVAASAENNVYALDADTGTPVWERQFPNHLKPVQAASGTCPNALNATPVIDKQNGMVYVLTSDGKLRGLGLADGDERMAPVDFVPPYSRNWSLNLVDGMIYTSTSRGCGGAVSDITAVDVRNPGHPVSKFYTSAGKGSGPWGRGGVVQGAGGMIAQTADGPYDPASGRFGNTFLSFARDLRLTDSYTPANVDYLNQKDFDLGSASPTVFPFEKWTLVAGAAKEGVIYLLDGKYLGGADHRTPLYVSPRYGNDARIFGFAGVWGSLSTWVDTRGQRWLLVPMLGPPAKDSAADFKTSHGPVVNGSLMAFQVKSENGKPMLVPVWMSHDLDLPGMPVIANGVVYVLGTGDRARPGAPGVSGGRGAGGPAGAAGPGRAGAIAAQGGGRGPGRGGPQNLVNVEEPGADRDAAWISLQYGPDGQQPGRRFSGGIDLTHGVIYALDAETGEELYSSKDLIDSWNHYGGMALSGGRLYLSTYDGRVFAFGLPRH